MKSLLVVLALPAFVASSVTPAAARPDQSLPVRVATLEAQVSALQEQVSALAQQVSTQAEQMALLQDQVNTIANPAEPFFIGVDCNVGQTVAGALLQAANHTGPVAITINGLCAEAVEVSRSNTSLVGLTPGAGLDPPLPSDTALRVLGASNVTVHQLTLTGGLFGLRVDHGGRVALGSSSVVGNSFHGIFVNNGTLELSETMVDGNGGSGIFAWLGSELRVRASTIINNGEPGISMQSGASAQVEGDTHISGNQGGIGMWFNSSLDVRDAVVENNLSDGISAAAGSTVLLNDGTVIRGNQHNGLSLRDVSVAGAFGNALIRDNGGWGVICSPAPAVAQLSFQVGTVTGNGAGQVSCPTSF